MTRKIIAIGWGYFTPSKPKEVETQKIDQEIIRLSGKKHPKLLFIPTASHDSTYYVNDLQKYFEGKLWCEVDSLLLYGNKCTPAEIKTKILGTDIVYVGGGNTYKMMRMWEKYGVKDLLRQAWENGTVMSGLSAGSICWFEHGQSDSRKWSQEDKAFKFMKVSGLGLISWLHCPHYDGEASRRPALHNVMKKSSKTAIALDNWAALEVIDNTYRIITSYPSAKAYLVRRENEKVVEREIPSSEEFQEIEGLLKGEI